MAANETTGPDNVVNIKVIGVGGAGNNAINSMIEEGTQGVEFIAINTDKPALSQSLADEKVQIGLRLTGGRGAGADPLVGRAAAEETRNDIAKALENAHMAFITGGMGGGTGTGAAPVVAEVAQEANVLTVGVVTKPFGFEGSRRMAQAENGIEALYDKVDALFVIPNERLKDVSEQKITFKNAFKIADDVLLKAVVSISDLVKKTDMINLDFADITTIMKESGFAHMGVGRATGRDKALVAAQQAIESPLMGTSIRGAKGIIIHVCGSLDLELEDVETAANLVTEAAHPDANIIFGAGYDETMEDEIKVTVIATRFDEETQRNMIHPHANAEVKQGEPSRLNLFSTPPKAESKIPDSKIQPTSEPTSAQTGAQTPEPQPAAEPRKVTPPDDDPFEEIYKIFNNK
ncbi:MAG: cell division protein FtsZ [Oscillospiraceae bacterium]|nr:cell division protein FtsZ [Oscillospiraceae bacterium]